MLNLSHKSRFAATAVLILTALFWGLRAPDAATLLPLAESCFQATTPTSGAGGTGSGMVGLLGTITAGTGGTSGSYGGIALTGGSGTQATANIVVSGGGVTSVTLLNPGTQYVVGDTLSAASGNIGGTTGFSVPVSSVAINSALAGGSVGFYVPSTLTTKQTWSDAGQTSLNTNPVTLDANGCAVIYGSGSYRQIVKDNLGNTIWDKLTADTSAGTPLWAGSAGGTANAITVTQGSFSSTAGQILLFVSTATNTGATTITVSSGAAINIFKHTPAGIGALTGGEIVNGHAVELLYNGTQFEILNQFPLFGTSQSITSATTTDLNTAPSHNALITGTTTITSFGANADVNYPIYFLKFNGALTLTYNASSMILPGAVSIPTAANDTAIAQYLGSGNWQVVQYQRAANQLYPALGMTTQYLISGTGATYTTPTGARAIKVRGCGGGGGGGAVITNSGTAGGNTTFNSVVANGGSGGQVGGSGGSGGTGGTGGTGSANLRLNGANGWHFPSQAQGGHGAPGFMGTSGGQAGFSSGPGIAAQANSCAGGGGGGQAATNSGGGGGAGEYMEIVIAAPVTTYTYTIGTKGTGGAAGTQAGGDGGTGILVVEEYYKFMRAVCEVPANDNYDFDFCKAA